MKALIISAALLLSSGQAMAQSIQYCAGVCGGTVGAQNVTPNPTVEACFQKCLNGGSTPAKEPKKKTLKN